MISPDMNNRLLGESDMEDDIGDHTKAESSRPKIFDLIDEEGWPLPVEIVIDYSQGYPDVIVLTDDLPSAM